MDGTTYVYKLIVSHYVLVLQVINGANFICFQIPTKDEIWKGRTDSDVWMLQHTLLLLPARNLD
jgi:hypothetical protein